MSTENELRERGARALVSDDSRGKDQEDLLWHLYLRDVEAVVAAFGVPWPVLSWVSANPEAAKGLAEGRMVATARLALDPESELGHAIEIARIGGRPYCFHPGSGQITTPYDRPMSPTAEFVDWGLARAVAIILNALNDGLLVAAASTPAPSGKVSAQDLDFGEHDTPPRGRFQDQAVPPAPSDEAQGETT